MATYKEPKNTLHQMWTNGLMGNPSHRSVFQSFAVTLLQSAAPPKTELRRKLSFLLLF
jgi:hypothetical protein